MHAFRLVLEFNFGFSGILLFLCFFTFVFKRFKLPYDVIS